MIKEKPRPSLLISLTPILFLITLLISNVLIFGDDASSGANQLALLLGTILVIFMGTFHLGVSYKNIEKSMLDSISRAMNAVLILMVVGALISVWIMCGVVPTMIYYGLGVLSPVIFLPAACLLCVIVSMTTGSSWSTSGTIGVALMGIGITLDLPPGMVAGAVISGAYFGDKMSPLSDTTNLAPAVTGTDLFSHIRHMTYTSGPALILSLLGFTFLGLFYQSQKPMDPVEINTVKSAIDQYFHVGLSQFLIPMVVSFAILRKMSALPALALGVILGFLGTFVFQGDLLVFLLGKHYGVSDLYRLFLQTAYGGFKITTGNSLLDDLFSRGGMVSMLSTIWLTMVAMAFAGSMEACGMIDRLAESMVAQVSRAGHLVGTTIASCIFFNITTCEQYLSIVIPGRMFKNTYIRSGLHPKNLSRVVEDSGTVTCVMVPWSSSGAYHSLVLGVPTLTYLPFCFFNIFSPLVSLFLATTGWTIVKYHEEKQLEKQDSHKEANLMTPENSSHEVLS